jgi:EAL domain-containing protein (putative c-di-GMP-specific phosphodiesterase class I)/GGDEF domain-containing protein
MNDILKPDETGGLAEGLARVVRTPTLLQFLDQQCRKAWQAGGVDTPPAVGWIVLDDLPQHRDQLGFSGVERLMHAIHERIRVQLDATDVSARFGIDSIGLVLDTRDGGRDFQRMIAATLKAISNSLFDFGEHTVAATISISVRPIRDSSRSPEFILVRVAREVEQMSQHGGNRGNYRSGAEDADDAGAPASLVGQLNRALRENTLKVVFQPLLATHGPERERAQLLPRLTGSDGELIPAARFIPVAAERGLLPALDRWMIQHALNLLQRAIGRDDEPPQYFLNQSAALIDDSNGTEWLREQLHDLSLPPECLVLEFRILELKPRLRQARQVLERLQALGIGISLAGVDESIPDAVLLKHLPANYLRMKPDFARRLLQDQGLADRFQKFTRLARAADRQLIVPMLEDAEEVSRIWQMDVDLIQGNFIQQPSEQPA